METLFATSNPETLKMCVE